MREVVILIAGTVVSINLIYELLPNGNFEKYSKYIFGLILILIFAGTLSNFDISSNVLDFSGQVPVYNSENISRTIDNQTEKMVENKVYEHLLSQNIPVENIHVELEENELKKIVIISKHNSDAEKICDIVSAFCDIDKELVVIE